MFKKLILVLVVVGLILPVGANACVVSIKVTASDESGQQAVATLGGEAKLNPNGNYVWVLGSEVPLLDNAAVESLKLSVSDDPEVGIEFGCRAGSKATTFDFLSDVIVVDPAVKNPTGNDASAGITLTDRGGGGAAITGLFSGGKTHEARYNSLTVFADLVSSFSIPSGTSDRDEDSGSVNIGGTVTSVESEFYFKLTGKDAASGTSTFTVTPEPATIALLGLGGLVLLRRKRAK
jgi:hypothetical protein